MYIIYLYPTSIHDHYLIIASPLAFLTAPIYYYGGWRFLNAKNYIMKVKTDLGFGVYELKDPHRNPHQRAKVHSYTKKITTTAKPYLTPTITQTPPPFLIPKECLASPRCYPTPSSVDSKIDGY